MQIKSAHTIPHVLRRAFDAFRANDPIGMAEAYSVDAKLETQYDSLIAQAFRLEGLDGAVLASSAVGILRFYAYELSLIDVKDVDIVSVSDKHGGMDIVSRWSVKLLETGENHIGYCNNRWRLDRSGRRIRRTKLLRAAPRARDAGFQLTIRSA